MNATYWLPAAGAASVRHARRLMIALHVPFILAAPLYTVAGLEHAAGDPVVASVLGLVVGALQLRHSLAATREERPAGWQATLLVLIALAYAPLPFWGLDWAITLTLVVASALMLLRLRLAIVLMVAIGVGSGIWVAVLNIPSGLDATVIYGVRYALTYPLFGAVLFASARLVLVLEQLHAARAELATAAADRERLRVSRDLHDVVGQSLSALSLKGDLALRLLAIDADRTRLEIESMAETARGTLRDIRQIAVGNAKPDLCAELAGAVTLLSAAGIAATVVSVEGGLPAGQEAVLAWAVRESTTNVLRHSDATECVIRIDRDADRVVLTILNDGVREHRGPGAGLTGLRERAEAVGGTLTSGVDAEGRFALRVQVG